MNNDYSEILCGRELQSLGNETEKTAESLSAAYYYLAELRMEINKLISEVDTLSEMIGCPKVVTDPLPENEIQLNFEIDQFISEQVGKTRLFPPLETTEYIIAAIAGALSVMIDVILVGTPEVVKLYRGGNAFDGSELTAIIRKIKPDDGTNVGSILKWLSEKCKVPYDISCEKDIVTPNNHRLRSLAHDPFLGLFFAVADILMGTTTCVDNNGSLRILPSYEASLPEKLLSLFYYVGHIISDLFTARGVPIPGFFLTQFFTNNGDPGALSKIAESMYMDGYDSRHLASMSVPVAVNKLIVESFYRITEPGINAFLPLAEKERTEQTNMLKKEKMLFIANSIGVSGNIIKFVAPPSCCNPCALNASQWLAFITSSIQIVRAACRDKSVENIMDGRIRINQKWERLLDSQ